jgi:hypothetical protein
LGSGSLKNEKMKKILLILLTVIIILFLSIATIPFLFKNKIRDFAISKVNQNINATLSYSGFKLSLIKSFPDFAATFHEVSLVGSNSFDNDTLLSFNKLTAKVDFMSVIRKETIIIKEIITDGLNINLIVDSLGIANWKIAIKDENKAADDPMDERDEIKLILRNVTLNNSSVSYNNQKGNYYFSTDSTNIQLIGKVNGSVSDLDVLLVSPSVNFSFKNVNYINNSPINLTTSLLADLENFDFKFKTGKSKFNDFDMIVSGGFAMPSDSMFFDIGFEIPDITMKQVLELVPENYQKYTKEVDATGDVSFHGSITGLYYKEIMPGIDIHFSIENGTINYPGLPDKMIIKTANALIYKPEGDMDLLMVGVEQLKMEISNNPLEIVATAKSIMTDPEIDLKLDGVLDLGSLTRIFPIDSVEMSGIIYSDVTFAGKMSDLKANNYESFIATAFLNIINLRYNDLVSKNSVSVQNGIAEFKGQQIILKRIIGKYKNTDLTIDGQLQNVLAFAFNEGHLNGNISIQSGKIDLDDLMPPKTEPKPNKNVEMSGVDEKSNSKSIADYAKRVHIRAQAKISELKSGDDVLKGISADLSYVDQKLGINNMSFKYGKSDLALNGSIRNLMPYLYEKETLVGDIRLNSSLFDANEIMSRNEKSKQPSDKEKGGAKTDSIKPMKLPERLQLTITTSIRQLLYDNMVIRNFDGRIELKDQKVNIQDLTMNMLDGSLKMKGSLTAKGITNPNADLDIDVKGFDIPSAYKELSIMQNYLPFAAKTTGKISTSLKLQTSLGQKLKMMMSNVNASGNFSTTNVKLIDSKALNSLQAIIQTSKLKSLDLQNFAAQYEIKGGNILFKPFKTAIAGQPISIGGNYNLGGTMNFNVDGTLNKDVLSADIQRIISSIPGHESITKIDIGANISGDYKNPNVKFDTQKIKQQTLDHIKKSSVKEIKDATKKLIDKYLN